MLYTYLNDQNWKDWPYQALGRVSHTLLVGVLNGMTTLEVWQFLHKLNIHLSYDLAIPFLGTCPKEKELLGLHVHIKTSMWMFTATLFGTAKTWKQPKYPSIDKRISNL